jgi:hypothetical protein
VNICDNCSVLRDLENREKEQRRKLVRQTRCLLCVQVLRLIDRNKITHVYTETVVVRDLCVYEGIYPHECKRSVYTRKRMRISVVTRN